jgi:hypothetical protein
MLEELRLQTPWSRTAGMYIRADTYPAGVEPLTVWLPSLGFLRIKTGRSSMRVTRRLALTVVFLNLTICFYMLREFLLPRRQLTSLLDRNTTRLTCM